jgi:two-component system OmpR family response regulator
MPQILLIDDDERLAELLSEYFERFSLELTSCLSPSEGLAALDAGNFELIILDVMLPEMDGFEVCKAIRKQSDIPIIMLTARGEVMDRVVGLELGADDYLPKPFEPRELVARIQNILKRGAQYSKDEKVLRFQDLVVDTELRQISLYNNELSLTSMEYQLMELFAKNPSKTFTRDEILNHMQGIDAEVYSRSVDILVSRLRQKLKPLEVIKTVRGSGYCFVGKKR